MNKNIITIVFIIIGLIYVISYLIYKKISTNYKKGVKALLIIGVLLIINQLLCYYSSLSYNFQLFTSIVIMGMFGILNSLISNKL